MSEEEEQNKPNKDGDQNPGNAAPDDVEASLPSESQEDSAPNKPNDTETETENDTSSKDLQPKDKKKDSKKEGDFSDFRVLIADDFQFMTELMSGVLREIGIRDVLVCENSDDAKRRISHAAIHPSASSHIDLALVDWLMPGMNGVRLTRWIRGNKADHIRFMPIILVSAYTNRKLVEAARDSGATEALVKPIAAETLISRLVYIINNPRPFVKSPSFFGPDRRRKTHPIKGEDRRKTNTDLIKVNKEQA